MIAKLSVLLLFLSLIVGGLFPLVAMIAEKNELAFKFFAISLVLIVASILLMFASTVL